jgi:hypothetical protein
MKEKNGEAPDVKVYSLTDHYNQSWTCYRAWLEAATALLLKRVTLCLFAAV